MARRRKNRTHLKGNLPTVTIDNPKSFVFRHGQVGSSVAQLVRDVRKVLEPNTASRIKERNRNKLRDYMVISPALQVNHLIAFTLSAVAPSMRILRLSAGPTLSFRVERYSLMKDVLHGSKHARCIGLEYLSAPLLVLASFPPPSVTTPPHIPLIMKCFQGLFPSLSPNTIKVSSARRVVLLSYNLEKDTVDFRHYIISLKPHGVSKRVRHVLEGVSAKSKNSLSGIVPNLGNDKDIADFLLGTRNKTDPGIESGYESATSVSTVMDEYVTPVSLVDNCVGRKRKQGQKMAIRLNEVGPRMELRLLKIVEGIPGKEGTVIYNRHIKKSQAEITALNERHSAIKKLRQQRKDEQQRNVERKKGQISESIGKSIRKAGDLREEKNGGMSKSQVLDSEEDWDTDEGSNGKEEEEEEEEEYS